MSVVRSIAKDKGMTVVWDSLVQPWLDQEDTLRASAVLSSPRAAAGRSTGAFRYLCEESIKNTACTVILHGIV